MLIFRSLQARYQLIESLNQRIEEDSSDTDQQLQVWKDELEHQQLADIDLYKTALSVVDADTALIDTALEEVFSEAVTEDIQQEVVNQNSWERDFADGFIGHLVDNDSPLYSIWFGKMYSYPTYIGFDIRRLARSFDFSAMDACWLAANLWSRQIYAGVHFRNPLYYQELESKKDQIDREFSQTFNGRQLEWNPQAGPSGVYRIRLLVNVDNNQDQLMLFEDLEKALKALDTIFKPHLDRIVR